MPSPSRSETTTVTSTNEPQGLMRAMLTAPAGSQLSGSPVTLSQVVAGAGTRAEQTQRIDAYWDLCSAVADYYLGLHEAEALARLQRRLPSSKDLREADRKLRVRVGTSKLAAVASQQRLASLMRTSSLGLPGDLPYCGEYDTRFDEIFSDGGPAEAQQLDGLLPLRFAELAAAADGVTQSERFVQQVNSQAGQSGGGMTQALELLALNRRAFVQIARDYNRRITRYAELSRPGRIDNGRLVAMLIGRSGTRLGSAAVVDQPTSSGVTFRSPRASGSGLR